jgi:hypothetical protein
MSAGYLINKYQQNIFPFSNYQLVATEDLIPFREYDRSKVPKYGEDTANAPKVVERLCSSIMEHGFREPLILGYDKDSNSCLLEEGNTRLAFALDHDIPFVPVIVRETMYHGEKGTVLEFQPDFGDQFQSILPSFLGLKTKQDDASLHPYFESDLEDCLKGKIGTSWWNSLMDADHPEKDSYLGLSKLFSDPMDIDMDIDTDVVMADIVCTLCSFYINYSNLCLVLRNY